MSFRIHLELAYRVLKPSTVLFNFHVLSTPNQRLSGESLRTTPGIDCECFPYGAGENRYVRIGTGNLAELQLTYDVTVVTNPGSRRIQVIGTVPIAGLNRSALPYLFPSRYCQSDRLGRFAERQFGHLSHPLAQAAAVADWVFENVEYVAGISDATTSACDTLIQRAGVCRDFAHLGIALCRALSIPSRYFAGYACRLEPADFHACFEVCVGNEWYVFDPTRRAPLNGLVCIATGRDAADASFATIFGSMEMQSMAVSCKSERFQPLEPGMLKGKAILLEP